MIVRTGIDIVAVAEVEAAVQAHGDRYLDRVYTARERADCTRADGTLDPERLAARWAAKEAAIKALRLEGGRAFTDIEVLRGPTGQPALELREDRTIPRTEGVLSLDVSLSHASGFATAVVVALVEAP